MEKPVRLTEENVNTLPEGKENVRRVLDVIKEKGLQAEIFTHPETAVTKLQTLLDLYGGTGADRALKCLCMVSKGTPLIVMASGEVRIDMAKLSKASHLKDIRMASPEELRSLFDRPPGGVDPIAISEKVKIILADKKLFEKSWVIGSAGSPYAGLKIAPSEITKCVALQVADLAEESKELK
jgi:prolyl-tRNA editing enzyme YbaK/EbsC (Cys-tRNA(Pro) deacylase)